MIHEKIIKRFKTDKQRIEKEELKDAFPIIVDGLSYLYSEFENDWARLSSIEQVEYGYEIYSSIIEYWIEILKKYIKETYERKMQTSFDEILSIGGCAAYDEEKNLILISVIGLMIQQRNMMSFVQPILHEFRHQLQHEFYKEKEIEKILLYPSYFLLIEKHYVYRKNRMTAQEYLENYTNYYPEVDAEEFSVNELSKIIPTLYQKYLQEGGSNKLNEKVYEIQKIIEEEQEEIKDYLRILKRIDTNISKELYDSNDIQSIFILEENEINSLSVISQFMNHNHKLQKEYPILRLLWNEDKPKSYQEIMEDRNLLLESIPDKSISVLGRETTTHQQIKYFYKTIIKSDKDLQLEERKRQDQKVLSKKKS